MNKHLGVLCHVSSVPSKYGVGDFGKSSFDFIDFLSRNNLEIWQILPLNTTNIYNCPYASTCCYSFDEMYVDPDQLLSEGKITQKDLKVLTKLSKTKKVAFSGVKQEKAKILELAFVNIDEETKKAVKKELKTSAWLADYAYFRAMLKHFDTDNFRQVPQQYWDKTTKEYKQLAKTCEQDILKYAYFQYLLNQQWQKVRAYAKSKGVKILGDLPIYPDPNSFDVFANVDQFKVEKGTIKPLVYGGVPADEFCADGQNWGTCVYDWDYMKSNNYEFMLGKIKLLLTKYDILRLDHFLGYVEHYEWDANKKKSGKWHKKGGEDFFKALQKTCDMNNLVIEDLGINKPTATKIRKQFNLKGMCVVQMIMEHKKNLRYLPDKVEYDNLYYLGTHDNNTFIGYLKGLNKQDRAKFCSLMGVDNKNVKQIHLDCIRKMLASKSEVVILQIQDYLMQNGKYRMNVPGQAAGCWEYKMPSKYKAKVAKTLSMIR